MPEQTEPETLVVALSIEQRAAIGPFLHQGETVEAFVAAAIRTELAWRRMTGFVTNAEAQGVDGAGEGPSR